MLLLEKHTRLLFEYNASKRIENVSIYLTRYFLSNYYFHRDRIHTYFKTIEPLLLRNRATFPKVFLPNSTSNHFCLDLSRVANFVGRLRLGKNSEENLQITPMNLGWICMEERYLKKKTYHVWCNFRACFFTGMFQREIIIIYNDYS